jgi:hypothetical protein
MTLRIDRPLLLFVLVAAASIAALASIPGYYSGDELQWLALAQAADTPAALQWVAFADLSPFQYRPLTFNLWLLLAHLGDERTGFMHGTFALLALADALLLVALLRRCALPAARAWQGATLFLLLPTTLFTAGWVGTLADLLVATIALAALWLAQHERLRSDYGAGVIALFSTALALTAKESALVLPLPWLLIGLLRARPRAAASGLIGAGIAVLLYLLLRADALFHPLRIDPYYDWRLAYLPLRLVDYLLFPLLPSVEEAHTVLLRGRGALIGAGLLVALWLYGCGWRARWRGLAVAATSLALIGPALVLPKASAHFAYLAGVGFAAGCALLPGARTRALLALHAALVVLLCWHDVNLLRRFHRDAAAQTTLLDAALAAGADARPLRLRAADPGIAHLLARSSYTPQWRRRPLQLVVLAPEQHGEVDFLVRADGRLQPPR